MPWEVQRVYQHALACRLSPARTSQAVVVNRLDYCWTTPRALARWLELAPAMVRACSSSRRQSRSRRSDCVVAVSRASHAGLLTGLACRAEHAQGAQGALSRIYMHARRRRLDRVSSPRPPSARQAPKLNKGSPLPRQRTPSLLSRHERPHLLCVLGRRSGTNERTNDDDDDDIDDRINDDINKNDNDHHPLTSPRSHPTLTHYATHLVSASHPRCIARLVNTKKPSPFPLHRLAHLRVTRRLHHPPSGTSDRARAVGPLRAASIARLPPVSLISQVLDLVAPRALRNLFGVVQHLLDRPAYLCVTST